MNVFFKVLMIAFVVLGISFEAVAKDKKDKAPKLKEKNVEECHWVGDPKVETCRGTQFAKGFAKCGAAITTAYCGVEYAGNVKSCVFDDNRGKTKDCFEESVVPFSERLRKQGRRRVVRDSMCVWDANESFAGENDNYTNCAIDGQLYTFRRASCLIENQRYQPMLFCKVADVSHMPVSCMTDETSPMTLACRKQYVMQTNRSLTTGESMNRYGPTNSPNNTTAQQESR